MLARLASGGLLVAVAFDAHAFCFREAAQKYHVNEDMLQAITKIESNFNPKATHRNSDGSLDVGLMQINSSHFAMLERDYGITQQDLIDKPCVNVQVGAWILAQAVQVFGPTWRAVGAYGAGNIAAKEQARGGYAATVAAAYRHMNFSQRKIDRHAALEAPKERGTLPSGDGSVESPQNVMVVFE